LTKTTIPLQNSNVLRSSHGSLYEKAPSGSSSIKCANFLFTLLIHFQMIVLLFSPFCQSVTTDFVLFSYVPRTHGSGFDYTEIPPSNHVVFPGNLLERSGFAISIRPGLKIKYCCYLVGASLDDLKLVCTGMASGERFHFFCFKGSQAGRTAGDSYYLKFTFEFNGKSEEVFVKYEIPIDDDDGIRPEDKDRGEGGAKKYSLLNISPGVWICVAFWAVAGIVIVAATVLWVRRRGFPRGCPGNAG
jgi:hypothetical protein